MIISDGKYLTDMILIYNITMISFYAGKTLSLVSTELDYKVPKKMYPIKTSISIIKAMENTEKTSTCGFL